MLWQRLTRWSPTHFLFFLDIQQLDYIFQHPLQLGGIMWWVKASRMWAVEVMHTISRPDQLKKPALHLSILFLFCWLRLYRIVDPLDGGSLKIKYQGIKGNKLNTVCEAWHFPISIDLPWAVIWLRNKLKGYWNLGTCYSGQPTLTIYVHCARDELRLAGSQFQFEIFRWENCIGLKWVR